MNIELLRTLGKVKKYRQGEFICVENEEGNCAFLLLSGNVNIMLRSFQDKPKIVATLSEGTIFGEMSLLENKPRNASVIAATEQILVLEIEKTNFLQILKSEKEIAYNLLKTLLERMESEMERMYRANIAYVTEFRRNKLYQQIHGLSCEQFGTIIEKDTDNALKMLKFLSHSLAEINQQFSC